LSIIRQRIGDIKAGLAGNVNVIFSVKTPFGAELQFVLKAILFTGARPTFLEQVNV
jgi:hypothetical protein